MPRRRRTNETGDDVSPKRRRYNFRSTPYRIKLKKKLADDIEGRKAVLSEEEFLEKNEVLKVSEKPGKALNFVKLVFPKINRKEHHTKDYEHDDIILRRGQEFTFDVIFDRDVVTEHDEITLQFAYGDRPLESKGTNVRLPLDLISKKEESNINGWTSVVKVIEGPRVRCCVSTSPETSIGHYRLYTDTKLIGENNADGRVITDYKDRRFIFLFNPWCKDDAVFIEDDEKRNEYVRNETGRIWIGSKWNKYGRPWNFGQFDSPVLDVALDLLEEGGLTEAALRGPVSVIRKLSAMANSMDEDGVLEGRWTETFPKNCTLPWEWTGSVPILKQFHDTKKPVQYGQCWVFSGIITTLCRALGIPTRSVTNFASAHDTDCSMTIDMHYDKEGDPLEELNDSIWNFHVWNESWFRRFDLPDGYDGWQAHDATPQEVSEGVMQCGPAPLKAIKEGHVYLNYDVGFVFAEVNGDQVIWKKNKDGVMEVQQIYKEVVGKFISTKAVGSDEREDVTSHYKYPEGSAQERDVVKFVNRFSKDIRKRNIYSKGSEKPLEINVKSPDDTMIGDDFEIEMFVKNKTDNAMKIRVKATLLNAYYTGVSGRRVLMETYAEELNGHEEKALLMKVPLTTYKERMNPQGRFQLFMCATDQEDGRMQAYDTSFFLKKPEIDIEMPESVYVKEETEVIIRFANTTRLTLTNAVISVEGSGLLTPQTIIINKDIKPVSEIKENIIVNPRRYRRAKRELIVTMKTAQIADITGSKHVYIEKKPKEDVRKRTTDPWGDVSNSDSEDEVA